MLAVNFSAAKVEEMEDVCLHKRRPGPTKSLRLGAPWTCPSCAFFVCLFCCLLWQEIDDCLVQAKDRSYDALVHFGKRGLNVAATAAVMAASKVKVRVRMVISISSASTSAIVWRGRDGGVRDSLTEFDHAFQSPIHQPCRCLLGWRQYAWCLANL